MFNVRDFGAVGDGSTDDTQAIQACINAAQQVANTNPEQGSAVLIPSGRYLIDGGPLLVSEGRIAIYGEGPSQTRLRTSLATASIIKVEGPASASVLEIAIEGIGFEGTNSNITGGQLVELVNVVGGWFCDLKIDNFHDGISFQGGNRCFFSNIIVSDNGRITGVGNAAILLGGTTSTGVASDVHFDNLQILANAGSGIYHQYSIFLRGFDGVYITNSHLIDGAFGIVVSPTSNAGENYATSLLVSNTYFDKTSGSAHLEIQGGGAVAYHDFQFSNCYFRESGNDAVHFASLSQIPEFISFVGCVFRTNAGSSIKVDETVNPPKNVQIVGCIFDGNNTAGGATDGDLFVRGENWLIAANTITGGSVAGTAIWLRSECTNSRVSETNLRASLAGSRLKNDGTGNRFSAIDGVALKTTGAVTISNPSKTATVTHGLAWAPAASDVSITPTAANANVARWWISGITATQFTINLDVAPTTSAVFSWSANLQS